MDYVDSDVGHGALTPGFTLDAALRAESEGLIPLFLHGHGGNKNVGFSPTDLDSHERGYPALVLNANGPVGALVLARRAVDIDLFLPGGARVRVRRALVVDPKQSNAPRESARHCPSSSRHGPANSTLWC